MHSGINVKIRGHMEKLPNIPIMSVTVPAFLRHYIRTYLCIAKNERIRTQKICWKITYYNFRQPFQNRF